MDDFEKLLKPERIVVERFVRFRIGSKADAEDVLQEVYLTAFEKFQQLKSHEHFKAWIISIARNKCIDYFRRKCSQLELPIDELTETAVSSSKYGISVVEQVSETLEKLGGKDKQILYLYYFKDLPQSEIAKRLQVPVGTVKSRLHTAKQNFKQKYPYYTEKPKGERAMKKLPDRLPDYNITEVPKAPFAVRCEELQGLSVVPKLGEKIVWGLYDFETKRCDEYSEVSVVGKAEVHGIEGVEVVSVQHDLKDNKVNERRFVAQLTDTHCRYLSETHKENDVKKTITFLDGEVFINNWGFGEDNCGTTVELKPKGVIKRVGNSITKASDGEEFDVVGRYKVDINAKSYDTVCVIDIGHFNNAVAIEQYIDQNGRTVLWRRFNKDDWAIKRYGKLWTEILPDNERITINGDTFVHWYDCITDYIL